MKKLISLLVTALLSTVLLGSVGTAALAAGDCAITFDVGGGEPVAPIVAPYGSVVSAPADPYYYGYDFGGWYADAAYTTPFTFTSMPANGATVYAKWISKDVGRGLEYRINAIKYRDPTTYREVKEIPTGEFLVEATVTNLKSTHLDTFVFVTYTAQGQKIGVHYAYANPSLRQTITLGANIDNTDGRVGEVKLMVLSSLRGFTPLAMVSPSQVVSEGFILTCGTARDIGNGLIQVDAFSFDTKNMKTLTLRGTVQDFVGGVYACDYYPAEGVHELTEVEEDVANKLTQDLYRVSGYITANQATGENYTELSNGVRLNVETSLDMLGHVVTAFYRKGEEYKSEKNPGTAYCVYELADYYTIEDDILQDKQAYLAVFGQKIQKDYAVDAFNYDGCANGTLSDNAYDETTYTAIAGTYGVDRETGKITHYIAPPQVTISQVTGVKTVAGRETIKIGHTTYDNMAENDVIVEYEGIAEDDIVAVKRYSFINGTDGSDGGKVYVEKIEPVRGKIEAVRIDRLNGYEVNYVTIDGKDYLDSHANIFIDGYAAEVLQVTEYMADRLKEYDAYIYDGKLIGAQQVAGAGQLEDAIFVVNTYSVDKSNGYGNVRHYYAQGVNMAGEEVSILIGIQGVNDVADDAYGLGFTAVTYIDPNRFYNFKTSLDREQAKKDIMYASEAREYDYWHGMTEKDGYFAVNGAGTINAGKLTKEDMYLTMGDGAANRLFLTEQTKFILVARPGYGVAELEIATYTGPISKVLNQTSNPDTIYVAAMADANGANKTAEVVVILTDKLNIAYEGYVYIAPSAQYSYVSDGIKYENLYFTETEEFKSVVTDIWYGNGFYEIVEIDEDGVYCLVAASYGTGLELLNMSVLGVNGNCLTINNMYEDVYALADNAVIVDTRTDVAIQNSAIAEIRTLADIQAALNVNHQVQIDLLLTDVNATAREITHVFISDVVNRNAPSESGTITVMYATGGEVTVNKPNASLGEVVTVTLVPEEGYVANEILLNGRVIATGTNATTFTVTGNHIVSATFVPIRMPKVEDAIFVVDNYSVKKSNDYGYVTHYYAQGVNAVGEEVSILIGIKGVEDKDEATTGLGYDAITELATGKFYNFEKSLDREQAKKDIYYGYPAQSYWPGTTEADGYFAVNNACTITPNKLDKDDMYLTMGEGAGNRLFLTESTKFILVERPYAGDVSELNIATYTGPISKILNLTTNVDDIYVAATADANGATKTAEVVVIMTDKLNLMPEGYVYISPDATYSITADGVKYNAIYFTETEEFKTVTLDWVYRNGFYEIVEIDEDGVYELVPTEATSLIIENVSADGVYGNNLIINTVNEDMFALADDAKIYDVRSAEWLEVSEVGEIASLKDIAAAIKGSDPYTVTFDLLLEEVDATTMEITHIFVKSISKGGYEI